MAQLLVRNLDDDIKAALKRRAQMQGHSLEEEVRQLLRRAVLADPQMPHPSGLGSRIAARFSGPGQVGLEAPLPELSGQAVRPLDWASLDSSP